MVELWKDDYLEVLPLLKNSRQPVVPFAVVEGCNPGRVYVDDVHNSGAAAIWLSCGYLYLLGESQGERFTT